MDPQRILIASLIVAVESLSKDKAPTSIGYNDFALMFALVQEQRPGPITASYISQYLKKHSAVPEDARLGPESVEAYLDRLKQASLVKGTQESGYTMHSELVRILSASVDRFKTPSLDELVIRGISLHAAWDSPFYR